MSNSRPLRALLALVLAVSLWPSMANAAVAVKGTGDLGVGSTAAGAGVNTVILASTLIAIAPGDFVWVGTSENANPGCTSVTDSGGNTYTSQTFGVNSTTHATSYASIATSAVAIGGTITATCTSTSSPKAIWAGIFTGVQAVRDTPPAAAYSGASGSSISIPQVAAMAGVGELVLGWGYNNINGTGITDSAPFTNIINDADGVYNARFRLSYTIPAVTTAQTWTMTFSSTRQVAMNIDAFLPSSGTVAVHHNLPMMGAGQ